MFPETGPSEENRALWKGTLKLLTLLMICVAGITSWGCTRSERTLEDIDTTSDADVDEEMNSEVHLDNPRFSEESVSAALDIVYRSSCSRLHDDDDCADLCDNVFVFCGANVDGCVEEYRTIWVEDFDSPVGSLELARACAVEVETRTCLGLVEDTIACDYFVTEGCGSEYDLAYSPLNARTLTSGDVLETRLCAEGYDWHSIALEEGQVLSASLESEVSDYVSLELSRFDENAQGHPTIEELEWETLRNIDDAVSFPFAPETDTYLLLVTSETSAEVSIRVEIEGDSTN